MNCAVLLLVSVLLVGVYPKRFRRHNYAPPFFDDETFAKDPFASNNEETNYLDAFSNECVGKWCGSGRECVQGECVCIKRCKKRYKPVCGSDGLLYQNHCELHRAACVAGKSITIDRLRRCEWEDIKRTNKIETEPPLILTTTEATEKTKMPPCTPQQYEILKDNLLLYNHRQLVEGHSTGKEYLVSLMFSHYDQNNNGNLEDEELAQASQKESLLDLASGCTLSDLITFDDSDHDGALNINEFYAAFSKLYSVSVVSLDKALEVIRLTVRVGDNVEIKCDVTGSPSPPIVWRRNGVDLSTLHEDDLQVFRDGSLYLSRVQLLDAGNYTCHAQQNRDVVQTHILTVNTMPHVEVMPKIQSRKPGAIAEMHCHVSGEPRPGVTWLKNDEPLKVSLPNKYRLVGNGTQLYVNNLEFADTGAYMCQATSSGGVARGITSLIIQETPAPTMTEGEKRFFVFHDWGISVYEPATCRLLHQVQATDIIPGTQEYVCGERGIACSWGRAIAVGGRYIYASQPNKDRVLIVSKLQMLVVDVVVTDHFPVELHYIPTWDQVWVVAWRSGTGRRGTKTVQVIRGATQQRRHHAVHLEPINNHFDLVQDLFLPKPLELKVKSKYGYVSHTNQRGLYKLDLEQLKYTRSLDLTPYNCVPKNLEFSALYGWVIMQCEEPVTGRLTGQLVLDALTDSVVSHKPELKGRPLLSPDSRSLITLQHQKDGFTITLQRILPSGLEFAFDVHTTLNVSDLAFFQSHTTHGFDLFASSKDRPDILFLNLDSGKVEMLTGVGGAMLPNLAEWNNANRPLSPAPLFSPYLVTTANEAVFVVNGHSRTVNCEIAGLVHPRHVVWVTMDPQ